MKNKKMWQLKQSTEPNTLEMYIYGDVEGDYFDWFDLEMKESETSANHFRDELGKYPNVKRINIYINSFGGSVFEGTAIYSQLRRHSSEKVVYVDGFACSIASVIAMAGDKVIMPSNTIMMIHDAMTGIFGNARELRKAADDLDTIMEGNRQAYLGKSNGKVSEKKLKELLEAETWLTAQQCLEYGFADEVLEREVDLTVAEEMLQKTNIPMHGLVAKYKEKNTTNSKKELMDKLTKGFGALDKGKQVTRSNNKINDKMAKTVLAAVDIMYDRMKEINR